MSSDIKSKHESLKKHAYGMVLVLVLLYLVGMFASLFVSFPDHASKAQLWKFASNQWSLATHIILGFVLLLGTLALVIRSIMVKDKKWIISSVIATVAVVAGVGAGSSFITSQSDSLSYIMSISFLVALLSYGWGIYAAK